MRQTDTYESELGRSLDAAASTFPVLRSLRNNDGETHKATDEPNASPRCRRGRLLDVDEPNGVLLQPLHEIQGNAVAGLQEQHALLGVDILGDRLADDEFRYDDFLHAYSPSVPFMVGLDPLTRLRRGSKVGVKCKKKAVAFVILAMTIRTTPLAYPVHADSVIRFRPARFAS